MGYFMILRLIILTVWMTSLVQASDLSAKKVISPDSVTLPDLADLEVAALFEAPVKEFASLVMPTATRKKLPVIKQPTSILKKISWKEQDFKPTVYGLSIFELFSVFDDKPKKTHFDDKTKVVIFDKNKPANIAEEKLNGIARLFDGPRSKW